MVFIRIAGKCIIFTSDTPRSQGLGSGTRLVPFPKVGEFRSLLREFTVAYV